MSAALDRVIGRERDRLEQEQRQRGTLPMDQHAQFRLAVRTVLTILLDETRDAQDRVQQATNVLLGLPVPMPEQTAPTTPAYDPESVLYVAGPDGLPTTTVYTPASDEGPLTAEEVAMMLAPHAGHVHGA